ncbi:DUF4328 domain-containing protein [Nakamurella flava]|uniref:DUF4328 domain-containing protein n=1 Tax=Nakamurella flava TaxID=2576308 RepID=A0A4U6QA80_9ACTN|nr:DUF4328 domain-containing protein [Nakamurella flava]TKV56821.1 DUF4328 domain-containing protein [Nakamurella flava]
MTAAGGPVRRCLRCGTFLPPPPVDGRGPAAWAQVSCPRCGRPPDGRRWVAHPPGQPAVPGETGPPTEPLPRVVAGPSAPEPAAPRVAATGHPRWGLPMVVWTEKADGGRPATAPRPLLGWAAGLLLAVAGLALFSAGAEIWRFVLLLQGRTAVLPAGVVRTSDVLVATAGLFTPAVTVAAFIVCVLALLRTSRWAADQAGVQPPRTTTALLLRLLVPGWNAYGAGQVLMETHALLLRPPALPGPIDPVDRSARVRRRGRRLILAWWAAWVINIGLVVATIARGWGGSLQAIADTVELHIAVDLVAAVGAVLGAVVLRRFAQLADVQPTPSPRWQVQRPPPTRGGAGPRTGDPRSPSSRAESGRSGTPEGDPDDDQGATERSATVSA